MIDLQAHSTVSDGQLEPSAVATAAAAAGVTVMSLTDHDAVAGVPEAIATARQEGIECVPAVEMSCVHAYSDDLHMLGYWVDIEAIAPACDRAQRERAERAREIIERLNAHGVEVSFEAAVAEAGAADSIGRPHIARAAGAGPDLGPFFEEYLVPGAKAFVPRRWPSAEEAVELIHTAGGVAVVAHPYWDVSEPRPGAGPGREPEARRRAGRDRDLLPAPHEGADGALPGALPRSSTSFPPAPRTSTAPPTRPSRALAPTTPTAWASRRCPQRP